LNAKIAGVTYPKPKSLLRQFLNSEQATSACLLVMQVSCLKVTTALLAQEKRA
jgi:hypothetical protein